MMKAGLWLSVSAVAVFSSAAQAQEAGTTDPVAAASGQAGDGDAADEIVVTAERRSTSLQRTPVAASVLTGEDLVRKSVNGVEGLQFATPSLTVNTAGQGNAFNIRGIGKTEQTSSIGVGVITYRDGVATLPGYFQTEPYYDIASVEVLRGPQGTFAGGNATGGAIFITQSNPSTDRVKGYALAQYGNYNNVKLQGALNIPSGDRLAIRFAGNMERRDTFYEVTGPWTGNPGNRRDYSARASILWQPSANFRLVLKGDYNNIEYGGLPASPAYFGSAATPTRNTSDPLNVASDAYLNGRDEFGRVVLNMAYTTDGGISFRSISGFQRGTTEVASDTDATATAVPRLTFRANITEEIWSQEFNIVSPDNNPFTWVVGGYYQDDKIFIPPNGGYYSDARPGSFSALDIEIVGINPKSSLAAFGQIGYEFDNGVRVSAGGRWSRNTSANDAIARAYITELTPAPVAQLVQKDKTVSERVNGKISIDWTIDASHFVYAFVATGTKAGGLNGPNLAGVAPLAFEPEDVTDFELGWKGTFMGGRLRTQLGGYYNLFENFQVNIVDFRSPGISSLSNVPGKTKLYGVEASVQGNFERLAFDMSASVSNSKLSTFYAADARLGATPAICSPATGPETARCTNLVGNEQTYAPKFTFSGGVQYAVPLSDSLTLTPRVDYAHVGSTWGTLFQNAALGDRLEARDIVNAQLTLATGDWSIAAFGTNLTDQHYVAATNGTRRLAGAPRQYGLRLSRSF